MRSATSSLALVAVAVAAAVPTASAGLFTTTSTSLAALALAAMAPAASAGMYSATDGIALLDDTSFDKRVTSDATGFWFVEVYAEWCGHCKAAASAVKQAAKALKGIVNVAAVDGDKASGVAGKLGVQGFPTFKLFLEDKSKPIDFDGGRDAASMVAFVMKHVNAAVDRRMGKKTTTNSGGGSGGGGGGGGGKANANEPGGGKHVITGTTANFKSEVLESMDPVLVEFYAPWCGHCKNLAAPLAEAAEELEGEVKVVAVDATAETSLGSEYNVRGYPTLKFFPGGKKTKASAQDYNGGRDKDSIVSAVRALAEASGGVRTGSAVQLTGPGIWDEHCSGKRLCIVAVLPHILDENAEKRNARLSTLGEVAGRVGKRNLFRFVWTEVGAQPGLEAELDVGLVPAVYAISVDKKVFTPYRGPWDTAHLAGFVNGLTVSSQGAQRLSKGAVPAIVTAPEWDGKDGTLAVEEEFSLDELDL